MNQVIHTKIQKWGNGLALRVAGLLRDIPKFEANTEVDVEVFEDGFTVKKVKPSIKPKYTLSELMAQCDETAPQHESLCDWDEAKPVGNEVW